MTVDAEVPEKKKRGRPTRYSAALEKQILARLGAGESLRSICEDDDMPAASTVRDWNYEDRNGFSARYARARWDCYFSRLDESNDNLKDATGKTYIDERGNERVDPGAVSLAKAYADQVRWEASKVIPEYGDKVDVNHGGDLNVTVGVAELVAKAREAQGHGGN